MAMSVSSWGALGQKGGDAMAEDHNRDGACICNLYLRDPTRMHLVLFTRFPLAATVHAASAAAAAAANESRDPHAEVPGTTNSRYWGGLSVCLSVCLSVLGPTPLHETSRQVDKHYN
jgi:hypothetical protein